jgi:hypothetical protein
MTDVSTGKEVIHMKYEKPEIALVASAITAIQCTGQKRGGLTDCPSTEEEKSTSAYEADE